MEFLNWEDVEKVELDHLGLLLYSAEEEFDNIGLRDFKVIERFKFYRDSLNNVFELLERAILNSENLPQFYNIEPTEQEKEKWKDDNEVCTFSGMWFFFGTRIPVYNDDYGQQNYIKFEDTESGEIIELSNGSFCFSPDNVAYQVLSYIEKEYVHDLKVMIKEKTGFDIDELLAKENEK